MTAALPRPPDSRWSAMRRWMDAHAPSRTLARALDRGDERFLEAWRYNLVNKRPYSDGSRRRLARYDADGFTPLQQMVRHARPSEMALVAHYADADAALQTSRNGQRLIDLAPNEATRDAVQKLLQAGLRQTVKDSYVAFLTDHDSPPIRAHRAVLSMVPWLTAGADPNGQTPNLVNGLPGGLLLCTFVSYRMLHATRVLLEHGADPHRTIGDRHETHQERTPYLQAKQAGATGILEMFDRQEALQLDHVVREVHAETGERPASRARTRL